MLNKNNFISFMYHMSIAVEENETYVEISTNAIDMTLTYDNISDYQPIYDLIKNYEENYQVKRKVKQFREHAQIIIDSKEFHTFYRRAVLCFKKSIADNIRNLIRSNKFNTFDNDQVYQLLTFITDHFTIEWDKGYDIGELK
jgi:hypothetical protein